MQALKIMLLGLTSAPGDASTAQIASPRGTASKLLMSWAGTSWFENS